MYGRLERERVIDGPLLREMLYKFKHWDQIVEKRSLLKYDKVSRYLLSPLSYGLDSLGIGPQHEIFLFPFLVLLNFINIIITCTLFVLVPHRCLLLAAR